MEFLRELHQHKDQTEPVTVWRPLNYQYRYQECRVSNNQVKTRAVAGSSPLLGAQTPDESLAGTQCMNRWDEGSWDTIPIGTEGSPS